MIFLIVCYFSIQFPQVHYKTCFIILVLSFVFFYHQDKEPKGIIPLENIQVREVPTEKARPYCFELFSSGTLDIIKACKVDSDGKVVEGECTWGTLSFIPWSLLLTFISIESLSKAPREAWLCKGQDFMGPNLH